MTLKDRRFLRRAGSIVAFFAGTAAAWAGPAFTPVPSPSPTPPTQSSQTRRLPGVNALKHDQRALDTFRKGKVAAPENQSGPSGR